MRFGRERASLASFKIHGIVTFPVDTSLAVMLEHSFAAFPQHCKRNAETAIRRFSSRDRLEEQVHRGALVERAQLSGNVGQATGLSRNGETRDKAIERAQNHANLRYRVCGWIHADHSISAAVQQAVEG